MRTDLRSWLAGLLVLVPLALMAAAQGDPLVVQDAWIREAPPNAMALAGYLSIENRGKTDRALVAVHSPAFTRVELHRSIQEGGVAKMVPQDSMPIPAGGRLVLRPGDYHLMMMHPTRPLQAGDTVEATLQFDDGATQEVSFQVRRGHGEMHEHHHHE